MTTLLPNKLTIDDRVTRHQSGDEDALCYSSINIAGNFFHKSGVALGLLPPVVRYISQDFSFIVLERPPAKYTISFKNSKRAVKSKVHTLSIPVPWQVYCLKFNIQGKTITPINFAMFFRSDPIWSADDQLLPTYIPNMWTGGEICIGSAMGEDPTYTDATIAEVVNDVISKFWASEFNTDISDFKSYFPDEIQDQLTNKHSLNTNLSGWSLEGMNILSKKSVDELMSMTLYSKSGKQTVQKMIVNKTARYDGNYHMKTFVDGLIKDAPLLKESFAKALSNVAVVQETPVEDEILQNLQDEDLPEEEVWDPPDNWDDEDNQEDSDLWLDEADELISEDQ